MAKKGKSKPLKGGLDSPGLAGTQTSWGGNKLSKKKNTIKARTKEK